MLRYSLSLFGVAFTLILGQAAETQSTIPTKPLTPEPIQVSVDELPKPFATDSAKQNPKVVPVPDSPTLNVPEGFAVNVYADDVKSARWLALTPEGDVLCSCARTNNIFLFKDKDGDGVAEERSTFLDEKRGAHLPFGMDFAKVDGQWYCYVANTNGLLRYPYKAGQTELGDKFETIAELPGEGYHGHWTRNVRVSPDSKHLYVTIGSNSNVDTEEPPRASVLQMNLDGSERKVFVSGIRNPVGFDFQPKTGDIYTNVNERDELGDNLVPDYFTRIQEGEFFGWPYAYLKPTNLDPRRMKDGKSERPELAAKTVTPDLLYQAHSAALGLAFTQGKMFPERYQNGAFTAMRGSWNRDQGTGYKIVFVPFNDDNRPTGSYEDFLTGFLIDPKGPTTWGRPVGVLFAKDGSLLFTEEMNGRIYRVSKK